MGELQRLSTQAEVMPLMRTQGGLLPSRELRQMQASLRQEVADGVVKKARIQIATDVAMDAMESALTVDAHRRSLAGDDPVLNGLLAQLETTHVQHLSRIQRGSVF